MEYAVEIGHFTWLRTHTAKYNVSSSGVMPITLDELLKLGEPGDLIQELTSLYAVDKRNLALTHGTQEGNFTALSALKELGIEEVVTVIPEYEPIRTLPRFLGLRQIEVEIHESLTETLNHVKPGTALFISNPNNPTGMHLNKKLLWELSDMLRRKNAYAVLDSIFLEFVDEDLRELPTENMVYTFSTSKFYTMNELKAGWVIGEEDIIKRINGIIDLVTPLVLNLDLGYAAILIRNREWIRKRNLDIIRPNQETLKQLTKNLTEKTKVHYHEHMPIAYIELKCQQTTGTTIAQELLTRDTLVIPGKYFGKDNGIRIGLATTEPNQFKTAMETITNTVNNQCK